MSTVSTHGFIQSLRMKWTSALCLGHDSVSSPPDKQSKSYTPPIETGADGSDQFRILRANLCVKILKSMRKDTDFGQKRWAGGLYYQYEMQDYHVMTWTKEHEKIAVEARVIIAVGR